jgi:hypothetical protein
MGVIANGARVPLPSSCWLHAGAFSNVAVTGGVIAVLALAVSPSRWH